MSLYGSDRPSHFVNWLQSQPITQYTPTPASRDAAALHDWHAEVAEYRLRHQGIKPELLRYVEGIGRAYR